MRRPYGKFLAAVTVTAMLLMCFPVVLSEPSDADDPPIPSAYDGRTYCNDVRDQGSYDVGWAFAAASCIESMTKLNGYDIGTVSPLYIAGSVFNNLDIAKATKPGMNTSLTGTMMTHVNTSTAMNRLVNGYGPVPETLVPYSGISDTYISDPELKGNDIIHITDTVMVPLSDTATIKTNIQAYGGGIAEIFELRDPATMAQHYSVTVSGDVAYSFVPLLGTELNHSVHVIGWNDYYPKDNFPAESRPSSDGAWLVRNSRGTSLNGEDCSGYYWISYESKMSEEMGFITRYDDGSVSQIYSYQSGISVKLESEVYTPYLNPEPISDRNMVTYSCVYKAENTGILRYITLDTAELRNYYFAISIRLNLEDPKDPLPMGSDQKGINILAPVFDYDKPYGGNVTYNCETDIYDEDIDASVSATNITLPAVIEKGTYFSINVNVYIDTSITPGIPGDSLTIANNKYISTPATKSSRCFIRDNTESWGDFIDLVDTEHPMNLRLNAAMSYSISSETKEGVDVSYRVLQPASGTTHGQLSVSNAAVGKSAIDPDTYGTVTIPSWVYLNGVIYDVTEIGNNAFDGCTNVNSIILPPTVKKIKNYAFRDCDSLETLWIPDSLTLLEGLNCFDFSFEDKVHIPLVGAQMIRGNAYIMNGVTGKMTVDCQIHTVSFDANGGSYTPMPFSCKENGSFIIEKYYGIKEGYGFDAWECNGTYYEEGSVCHMYFGDITLTAQWGLPQPNLTDKQFNAIVVAAAIVGGLAIIFSFRRL